MRAGAAAALMCKVLGLEAFQESLPGQYEEPKDGLFIIIFPAIGLLSTLVGIQLLRRLAGGAPLHQLRAIAVSVLAFALLTLCPIAAGIGSAQANNGRIRLEWGFYASIAASLAVGWAGLELLGSTGRPAVRASGLPCPACGESNAAGYRYCTRWGADLKLPDQGV